MESAGLRGLVPGCPQLEALNLSLGIEVLMRLMFPLLDDAHKQECEKPQIFSNYSVVGNLCFEHLAAQGFAPSQVWALSMLLIEFRVRLQD